ncbi:DNA methylase [Mycobacterium phage Bipolar]|uniref:DNA methyltransferase n=1 Tax=Mycobacterium phage Bipolar TaxID=1551711 RepID=UPI00051AA2D1|nr:DNA methyltransferase [Mycobacterium phage Bipolar]AIT13114.1 DNA methylase [Mycobacterium phage Bipolar]
MRAICGCPHHDGRCPCTCPGYEPPEDDEGRRMNHPYYQDDQVTLYHGDALDVLAELPDRSVDAVVCDPPYELEFMGKKWDGSGIAFDVEMWEQCLRVLKPGGHLLAFGGSRTWHRMTVAIEDAGFEIRDSIAWLNGSGFPKSLDVSKAIDKAAGAEREVVGSKLDRPGYHLSEPGKTNGVLGSGHGLHVDPDARLKASQITAPATDAAKQWQGWGTALKPSYEPVCVAVKPYGVTDILDAIGSHITRLEDECRPPANGAARSSAPTPADSQEVRADSAPESAATPHEGEQARTTPTGAAAGSSAATDTSAFELEGETCWNTVTSWRACWDELYDLTSTSTTSTASSLTTDLRTLWSSIASLTVTSTPDSPTPRLTSSSTASAVDSLFAATVLRSRATLALSAPESATASTQPSPQGAGGRNTAFEPIVVARKPLVGTVAANVLEHGTGALNIDACRIGTSGGGTHCGNRNADGKCLGHGDAGKSQSGATFHADESAEPAGRWPTNVVLDEAQAAELDAQTGYQRDGTHVGRNRDGSAHTNEIYGARKNDTRDGGYGGGGGGSRFFPVFKYQAKAPAMERPGYVNEDGNKVAHNTVKPLDLMRWLVRLVTPPNGVVLDPFAGSGTTAEACIHEHKRCITIEREADYLPLIVARLSKPIEVGFDFGDAAS